MKSINLSSRDLQAFLALAQTQHFTRASEQCHLSQSAFSQKISRIEKVAGLRLFDRSTRNVTLTPEGTVFAAEVRRIQQDLERAINGLRDLAALRAGKVTIAALPSVAAVWMPKIIARYRAVHPMVQIALFDTLATGGLAMLREGKVDLAIMAGGDMREFDTTVLKQERFYLVCASGHPLAARKSVALSQLAGMEMIHMARSSSVRQHLDAMPLLDAAPAAMLEVEHLATAAALVAEGLGVSVVPELTLFHFRREGLSAVPIRDAGLRRPIVLARRKGQALSLAAQNMLQEITAQARA